MESRRTPLHARHVAAGARLMPFAGWEMPLQYAGTLAEHRAVRAAAGLFDVSHMGELAVRGPAAGEAVDRLCANDPRGLRAGQALYTPLCADDGGTLDDAVLYCLAPGRDYLFIVNAANLDSDREWMRAHLSPGAEVIDLSAETALLALQGPAARAVLGALLPPDRAAEVLGLRPFTLAAGVPVVGVPALVARTGYTGEDGFEIACPAAGAGAVWDALLEHGAPRGLLPCGLGARDTLRLEAALPLYGHELSRAISPLEARLGRFVRVADRECCGAAALRAMADAGPPRELLGLVPLPPAIAREGAEVSDDAGRPVGVVTSGTFAPSLGRGVALALCRRGAGAGPLHVSVRGRVVPATLTPLPFYRRAERRGRGGAAPPRAAPGPRGPA